MQDSFVRLNRFALECKLLLFYHIQCACFKLVLGNKKMSSRCWPPASASSTSTSPTLDCTPAANFVSGKIKYNLFFGLLPGRQRTESKRAPQRPGTFGKYPKTAFPGASERERPARRHPGRQNLLRPKQND